MFISNNGEKDKLLLPIQSLLDSTMILNFYAISFLLFKCCFVKNTGKETSNTNVKLEITATTRAKEIFNDQCLFIVIFYLFIFCLCL